MLGELFLIVFFFVQWKLIDFKMLFAFISK